MKAQALVYFLTEILDEEKASTCVVATMSLDGDLSHDGSFASIILMSIIEDRLSYALRHDFNCSNNEAEYETLLVGLQIDLEVRV